MASKREEERKEITKIWVTEEPEVMVVAAATATVKKQGGKGTKEGRSMNELSIQTHPRRRNLFAYPLYVLFSMVSSHFAYPKTKKVRGTSIVFTR